MDTLEPDDFILAKPQRIAEGRIEVASKYWTDIDIIIVDYTDDATLSEPFVAKVESVEQRRATATPTVIPGSDIVSPGDQIEVWMNRVVNGIPTASSLAMKNLSSIYVPGSELGALVSARVHHIRSKKADAKLIELIESGVVNNELIQARIERGEATAITNDDRISDVEIRLDEAALVSGKASVKLTEIEKEMRGRIEEYGFIPKVGEEYSAKVTRASIKAEIDWPQRIDVPSIKLDKPALVSGGSSVKLTKVGKEIEGRIEKYDFIPKIGEKYSGEVTRGSTEAEIDWPRKIGVSSIEVDYPADATMDATIVITDVSSEIRGRILNYKSIPEEGSPIEVTVERGDISALPAFGEYQVVLESEPVLSGKAKAKVTKSALPLSAEITEYELISPGDVVGAKFPEERTNIAQPYTGDYEIILEEEKAKSGYSKVRIKRIDESGVYGREDKEATPDLSSNDDDGYSGSRNPITGGGSNRNDLISDGKL